MHTETVTIDKHTLELLVFASTTLLEKKQERLKWFHIEMLQRAVAKATIAQQAPALSK